MFRLLVGGGMYGDVVYNIVSHGYIDTQEYPLAIHMLKTGLFKR